MSEKEVLEVINDLRKYAENGHFFFFDSPEVAPIAEAERERWYGRNIKPIEVTFSRVMDYLEAPDNEKGRRLRKELGGNWRGSIMRGQARAYQYMLWSMIGCDLGKRSDLLSGQRELLEETKYGNPVLSRYVKKFDFETAEVTWKKASVLNDATLDSMESGLRDGIIILGAREQSGLKGFSLFKKFSLKR